MGKPTEESIKRYMDRLIKHLREMRKEHIIKLLGGEDGVRELVTQILTRMQYAEVEDPEKWDWKTFAGIIEDFVSERIKPAENREAVLRGLGDRAMLRVVATDRKMEQVIFLYLPPPPEEQAKEVDDRLMGQFVETLKELLKTMDVEEVKRIIAEIQPRLIRGGEYYSKWVETLKKYERESEKVRRLEKVVKSLRKRLEEAEKRGAPREAIVKYQSNLVEEMKKLEKAEAEKKRLEEELKKLHAQIDEFRRKLGEAPETEVTVRFLMDFETLLRYDDKTVLLKGKAGEVTKIPKKLYDAAKKLIDKGEVAFIELVEPKAVVLTDEEYDKLWKYFEEVIVRKFKMTYKHVWLYKERFVNTIDRSKSYEENLRLVDRLLTDIAGEALAMPKRKAERIIETRPKWAEPKPPERVLERPEVVPYRPPPKVEIPEAPIEPMPFPRRLASSEIKIFESEFKRRLMLAGFNPEDYIDYWIRFRDAWHKDWDEVLKRFKQLIEGIELEKPPPVYIRIPPWKEIPRDPVLHMLWLQRARSMEELIELLRREWGVIVTREEVVKIVRDEWKKGDKMDTWLKMTPKDYLERIVGKLE